MSLPSESQSLTELLAIMAKLRDPDGGCPWDLVQDFSTIAPHTIEEAYEVADAIEHGDMAALKDELGDLLFQVAYHAQMASELGAFDFNDVANAISAKMIRRHPHVFGNDKIADAAAQTEAWEAHKAAERAAKADQAGHGRAPGALDGVTRGLPALTRAFKLQKRAARVGFDWPDAEGAAEKVREELDEVLAEVKSGSAPVDRLRDELGDLLFSAVNLARKLDIEPETAMRHANAKFEDRFGAVEAELTTRGKTPQTSTLEEMDAIWNAIKAAR